MAIRRPAASAASVAQARMNPSHRPRCPDPWTAAKWAVHGIVDLLLATFLDYQLLFSQGHDARGQPGPDILVGP